MPLGSLGPVLGSAHVSTVRLILQYYDRNKDALQVNVPPQETRGCFSPSVFLTPPFALCWAAV